MVDAMRSSVSGSELAALGHADGTPAMLAASVAARRREADARWRPAPPASGGRSGPDTPDRAPSARARGISHPALRVKPGPARGPGSPEPDRARRAARGRNGARPGADAEP